MLLGAFGKLLFITLTEYVIITSNSKEELTQGKHEGGYKCLK